MTAGRVAFAVPGSIDRPTGGTRYDRRVIADIRSLGTVVTLLTLPASFPAPSPADLTEAEALIAALPANMPVIIDGLAFGVMADAAARLALTRPLIALVHHPLALETGVSQTRAAELRGLERAALAHARAVIVTSPATSDRLVADYGVARSHITIALPGVDPDIAMPRSSDITRPMRLLSVGSLIPRKGYLDLIAAYADIADFDWTADIIGDPTLDSRHAAEIRAAIARHGLQDRIALHGAIEADELAEHYRRADCFVLASHYEGWGMAYTEAIAAGLMVIGTTGAQEAIGDGGVMIAPGDVAHLGVLLRGVVTDAGLRSALLAKAQARAKQLPRWRDAAAAILATIAALECSESPF